MGEKLLVCSMADHTTFTLLHGSVYSDRRLSLGRLPVSKDGNRTVVPWEHSRFASVLVPNSHKSQSRHRISTSSRAHEYPSSPFGLQR